MANLKGCFSHKTDDWRTPSDIYKSYMDDGWIDPCPFQASFNGLEKDFHNAKLFVNPPYSDISSWVDWCIKQWRNGCMFALLVPARTDTKWFHKLLKLGVHIKFFEGRLHFNDSKNGAPFPSIIIMNFSASGMRIISYGLL